MFEQILKITTAKLKYINYSERTAEIYLHYIRKFLESTGKYPQHLVSSDFQKYLDSFEFSSISQQNQIINAIRFLYKFVLDRKYDKISFKRPRKEKHLPKVIDKATLLEKIKNIPNLKHKAILMTAYSGGLRVSEIINLKVADIDSARMLIHINNAKGRKDRIVKLSDDVLKTLREYWKAYRPKNYMFEGQFGEQYSSSSCNEIYKKYIDKNTSFHALRHSCFTAMLEGGVDLRVIQKVAGHSSSKTTEIYTHVSNNVIQNVYTPI